MVNEALGCEQQDPRRTWGEDKAIAEAEGYQNRVILHDGKD